MRGRTEINFIRSLVSFIEAKTIVEVGVAWADTTIELCRGANENGGIVYGFDNWEDWGINGKEKKYGSKDLAESNITKAGFSNFILEKVDLQADRDRFCSLLNKYCPNGIDFAFIDSDHSYLGPYNDFLSIYPLLNNPGIIAFHDTMGIDGCREFILDLRTKFNDGTFDIIDFPFGISSPNNEPFGLSILSKRSYSMIDKNAIFQFHGSVSTPYEIEMREKKWIEDQINKGKHIDKSECPKITSLWGNMLNRKKYTK